MTGNSELPVGRLLHSSLRNRIGQRLLVWLICSVVVSLRGLCPLSVVAYAVEIGGWGLVADGSSTRWSPEASGRVDTPGFATETQ